MTSAKVEISIKTLITIAGFLLALWVIYIVRDVLVLLFVAFILKSAISPIIDYLEKRKLSRGIAILVVYITAVIAVVAAFAIILPVFVVQIINLINNFPQYVDSLSQFFSNTSIRNADFFGTLSSEIASFSTNIFRITLSIFSVVLAFISVAVITFYFLLDEKNLKNRFFASLPEPYAQQITRILHNVEIRLGAWVRGQLLLSLIIGVLYFIGLFGLGIPNPLALGLIAAIFEVVPIIGPIAAAIPAVIIALTISPAKALFVIVLFIVVQQLENHIIVPKVMQKATGLSPLIVLIAILVGGRILGAVGILLAVPAAVVMQEVLSDLWEIRNKKQVEPLEPIAAAVTR